MVLKLLLGKSYFPMSVEIRLLRLRKLSGIFFGNISISKTFVSDNSMQIPSDRVSHHNLMTNWQDGLVDFSALRFSDFVEELEDFRFSSGLSDYFWVFSKPLSVSGSVV